MLLTDISIRNLKPPETGQVTYPDDSLPGFGIRISQGGTKTFVLVYGRSRRRRTIGRVGVIKLKEARDEAKAILAQRTLGKPDSQNISFEKALSIFDDVKLASNKASTRSGIKYRLDRHFLPKLRYEKLADVQTDDIAGILDRLKRTPSEAFHAYTSIRLFFRWAVGRKYIPASPLAGLPPPKNSEARSRVLSDEEVVKVLRFARAHSSPLSRIVQVLLLTGQRRGEIAALCSTYIDKERLLITLPPELTKNKREHTFPYGPIVASLLEGEGLLFPARGREDRPFIGWSKGKVAFDRGCGVADWTLHDLRRTFATNLAALGIPIQVTEKLLNHISGASGGIVAIYQRHTYMDEMRAAIAAWEAKLTRLLDASPTPETQIEPT